MQGRSVEAPNLVVLDKNGQPVAPPWVNLEKSAVVFWATWCGPCKVELARLKGLANSKSVDAKKIFIVSVGEELSLVNREVQDRSYPFESFVDPDGKVSNQYQVQGTPTIVLMSKEKIDWITTGLSPSLEVRFKSHLGE